MKCHKNGEEYDKISGKSHLPKSTVCVIIKKIVETSTTGNNCERGHEQISSK